MTEEQVHGAPATPASAEPGSLDDLLERVAMRPGVVAIDEVWLFPARKAGHGESTLFVISAFEDDPERRRVLTARFAITRDANGAPIIEETFEEQASAPADRVARVIDGVIRRLGDEMSPPRYGRIERSEAAWEAFRQESRGPSSS
jgi:hypothetical protein